MARRRKTEDVQVIVDTVNRMMAAPGSTKDGRVALSVFLSDLLLRTGNDRGFNYLAWTREGGAERWRAAGQPADTTPFLGDQTRVEYY